MLQASKPTQQKAKRKIAAKSHDCTRMRMTYLGRILLVAHVLKVTLAGLHFKIGEINHG